MRQWLPRGQRAGSPTACCTVAGSPCSATLSCNATSHHIVQAPSGPVLCPPGTREGNTQVDAYAAAVIKPSVSDPRVKRLLPAFWKQLKG